MKIDYVYICVYDSLLVALMVLVLMSDGGGVGWIGGGVGWMRGVVDCSQYPFLRINLTLFFLYSGEYQSPVLTRHLPLPVLRGRTCFSFHELYCRFLIIQKLSCKEQFRDLLI